MSLITLTDVSLTVPVYEARESALRTRLIPYISQNYFARLKRRHITLLKNLNYELVSGDRIGVMGENGAGKSTFLRVLAGSYIPTAGRCYIEGQVTSFFNIGLGFEQNTSGYSNIILRSLAMGRSYAQAKAVVPEILEFTKLGDAIKRPISTYSQGMRLRLAFAILTAHEHDIILMDEWVGAGDRRFSEAAQERLQRQVDRSQIMVVASHNRNLLRNVCNGGIVLDRGQILFSGEIDQAVEFYETEIVEKRKLTGENLRTSKL